MQCNEVKAFRQRLVRGGFTNISINDNYDGTYSVYCTTPDFKRIFVILTIVQMNAIPRLVYFIDL